MRKKMRLFNYIAMILCCTLFSVSLKTLPAKAEGELTCQTFVMENGASLRLKEGSNGMRFTAEISAEEYTVLSEAGAKFGMLIVAKDLLKTTELTPETVFGEDSAFYFTNETDTPVSGKIAMLHISSPACQDIDEDTNMEISGAIVNILVSNFTRSFIGVAYVAIPSVNAETGATEYTYHFAPYYGGDIANNTRCMYYVAQRAIEKNDSVAELTQLYINPFSTTSRYTNYVYAVEVRHHYIIHDENGEHRVVHTETHKQYGKLNEVMTALPIEKPTDTGKQEMEGDFIFDAEKTGNSRTGIVYAGGMQTLDMYYEREDLLSEDKKQTTLDTLLADFLNVANAEHNFGLIDANNPEAWTPSEYKDENGKVVGINLHTTAPQSNKTLVLSQEFFADLRGYGVKTITFTLDSHDKKMTFAIYQEESSDLLKAYDPTTKQLLDSSKIKAGNNDAPRITIDIDDVTSGGGVRIEISNSSSSNNGDYVFENVVFGFEAYGSQTAQ